MHDFLSWRAGAGSGNFDLPPATALLVLYDTNSTKAY